MTTDWIELDKVNYDNPEIKQIHCDTRDFCTYTDTQQYDEIPNLKTVLKYKDRFFWTLDEIKETLIDLKQRSGGDKDWRFLSFKRRTDEFVGGGWEFKYLRFYLTEHGWICRPRNDMQIVKKSTFKLPIDGELL